MFGSDDDATATYKVGHWIIYNYPLGVGTYATVHLAAHQSGELQVACKSIALRRQEDESCPEDDDDDSLTSRDSSWVSPTDRRKLGAEVEILKKLDHRNVASFLDVIVEEEHERIHLIVELVTGGDLWNYTAKHGSFSEDEVRFFAWQLVKALSYLHGHGIAHRGELISQKVRCDQLSRQKTSNLKTSYSTSPWHIPVSSSRILAKPRLTKILSPKLPKRGMTLVGEIMQGSEPSTSCLLKDSRRISNLLLRALGGTRAYMDAWRTGGPASLMPG